MSIVIGTLCLNEMEWLPKLYEQHKDWPGLIKWVFVEAADAMYAQANPEMVSPQGLSVDGTTEYLEELEAVDSRVIHVKYGITSHPNPAQGKCAARQAYLDVANSLGPELVLTLDADEFYCQDTQRDLMSTILPAVKDGFTIRYRNIWHPPVLVNDPLFSYEAVGKFWGVLVCKLWKWSPGMSYRGNHNSPTVRSRTLNRNLKRLDATDPHLQFIHMGFASSMATRTAKNRYYVERGEGRTDHRGSYVKSRAAFEHWSPGMPLPNGDKIVDYTGPIPECFR